MVKKEKPFLLFFTKKFPLSEAAEILFRHHLTGIVPHETEKLFYCKKLCKYA